MTQPGPYGQVDPMNQPGAANAQQWQQPQQNAPQGGWQQNQPQQGWQQAPQQAAPAGKTVPSALGPLTIREWGIVAGGAILLIMSFLPLVGAGFIYLPIWATSFSTWLLGVILPVIAAGLVLVRRLAAPNLRILGFGVDQLVSVTAIGALLAWGSFLINGTIGGAPQWIATIVALALIALSLVAPYIPGLKDDFEQRPELAADASTLGVRPITRLAAAAPAYGQGYGAPAQGYDPNATGAAPQFDPNATSGFGAGWGAQPQQAAQQPAQQWGQQQAAPVDNGWGQQQQAPVADFGQPAAEPVPAVAEPVAAVAEPVAAVAEDAAPVAEEAAPVVEETAAEAAPAEAAAQSVPFWALSPVERSVVDEAGNPVFQVGPTAWALVVEDRGDSYVIRHDDGRTGVLNDISGVTRG